MKTESNSRAATLSNPLDIFSLSSLAEQMAINGQTWTRVFSVPSRTWTISSPAGRKTVVTLDAKGHVLSAQRDGLTDLGFAYDGRGKLVTVSQGARQSVLSYTDGILASLTNPLGHVTTFAHNDAGRITAETAADQAQTLFGYDPNGNLTRVTPPGRPLHGQTFTPTDLLASYDPPPVGGAAATTTLYTYDLDRFIRQTARPDSVSLVRDYDSAGRIKTLTIPTGTIIYGYSAMSGKLTSISGPSGQTLTLAYDGPLTTDLTSVGQVSGALHWTYDTAYRKAGETVNGGASVTFAYDGDGLLTQAGSLTLTRAPLSGLLTGTTLGNITDSYSYNSFGELDSYTAKVGTSGVFSQAFDPRDSLGRIATATESVQGTTHVFGYSYNRRGWLTDVTLDGTATAHYDYDTNGNRVRRTTAAGAEVGAYDDQDRLLSYGAATYAYGANGELTNKTEGPTSTMFSYDAMGDLLSVLTASKTIEYLVDGQARRVGKKLNGQLVKGFIWDGGLRIIAEFDGNNGLVNRFVYADRSNVPVYMVSGTNTYRLITDHLGSVRLVVRLSDGSAVQRIDYDEFGSVINDSNPGFQPFGFAGGVYDPDTNLVRFGERDYDPQVGRWLSKDPQIFVDGVNLYAYVRNDPVNLVDPEGGQVPSDLLFWQWFEDYLKTHRDRNQNNKCPQHEPTSQICYEDGRSWNKDWWDNKWRGSDGSECIYDDNSNFKPGGETFNYGPDPWTVEHVIKDVLPEFIVGHEHPKGQTKVP